MWKWVLLLGLPLATLAQAPGAAWGGGVGVGNGMEAQQGRWLALGSVRYRWWGPSSGPGSRLLDDVNTRSRQLEVAAMAGYGLPLGRGLLYGGLGLGYLSGRQLGDYRYAVRRNSLLGDATYYYAYRDYQALGIPLEVGVLTSQRHDARVGLAFQANFNPEKTLYCGMVTL